MDDVINISGHRLGTAEIEDCLVRFIFIIQRPQLFFQSALPAVNEAAVVGIPDDVKGETAFAYVILNQTDADPAEIKTDMAQHVAKQIAKFAVPKSIVIVPGLPKTRSGTKKLHYLD